MDFVKREQFNNMLDEESYKAYAEALQKSAHQLAEQEYQHAPITMEQLHQAMQSTLAHNFTLSPRQMNLVFKNNLTRFDQNPVRDDLAQELPRLHEEMNHRNEIQRNLEMLQQMSQIGHGEMHSEMVEMVRHQGMMDVDVTRSSIQEFERMERDRVDQNGFMPFPIKCEQEEESQYYEGVSQEFGDVNLGVQMPIQQTADPLYFYSTQNPNPEFTRSQFQNFRQNPENLIVNRPYDFVEEKRPEEKVGDVEKPQDKPEDLTPSDSNENDSSAQNKLTTDTEYKSLIEAEYANIKGEYSCYKCKEIFPTKRGLKQHFKTCCEEAEKTGKFACTQCAYKCQSPAILRIHERTHTGEKPFSCKFCDYKSGQKNNVAKHILVHMKEKPFRCQYCDYRCAQKNNLVVHERTHTGYKPFACTYCDYRTVQKPNLVKHMYLHTDQKPFSCDLCSYKCVQKTNLTKHKQRHQNEMSGEKADGIIKYRPYRPREKSVKCMLCPYKCVQKSSLNKHVQFKHSEVQSADDESIQNLSVRKEMSPV